MALSPAKMRNFAPQSVRDAVAASRDQSAAVGVLLRSDQLFDVLDFANDVKLVRDGSVSYRVLWAGYPVALSLFGFLALLVLLVLWRLIFGRRPRIVGAAPK